MSNVITIKHGSSVPTVDKLKPYELGYVSGGALYINNNGTIAQVTDPKTIGIIDNNNRLKIPFITGTSTNLDKFMVCNSSGVVYYKTAANTLSELGALPLAGGTLTGNLTVNGAIIVGTDNYGTTDPNTAKKQGVVGQLYFVVTG